MGLLDFLCMRRSMATFAPSTTSARRLFCPTGRMDAMTCSQPFQFFVVSPVKGTPPPLEPNVTRPSRSRSPRLCTTNRRHSRSRLILRPCIDDETGMTTTISSGICSERATLVVGRVVALLYSVAMVAIDRLPFCVPEYPELTDDTRRVVFVILYSESSSPSEVCLSSYPAAELRTGASECRSSKARCQCSRCAWFGNERWN